MPKKSPHEGHAVLGQVLGQRHDKVAQIRNRNQEMQSQFFSIDQRDDIKKHFANFMIALFFVVVIGALDFIYHTFLNDRYVFRSESFQTLSFLQISVVILLATYMTQYFFWLFFASLIAISALQIITFEYFGGYILPQHYIQLLPDFMIILESLAEVWYEIAPVLTFVIIGAFIIRILIAPLARQRRHFPFIAPLMVLLLLADLGLTRVIVSINREKMWEESSRTIFPRANLLGAQNAYRSFKYLTVAVVPDMLSGDLPTYPALPAPDLVTTPDVNVILILGETVRSSNLSVLGYDQPTTPFLEQTDGLFARSIYTSGTMTRTTFAALFNRLEQPGLGEQFTSKSNCLFRLAKENRFQTHFLYSENQSAADTLLPFVCPNDLDIVALPEHSPAGMRDYDRNIFHALDQIDFTQPNFVVIMPKGAHSPYGEKSPDSFKIFSNDYDNALHYFDFVVSEIIDHVRENSTKPAYIIVTGDHGELLKGESDLRGHGWFRKDVIRVPFMFLPINTDETDSMVNAQSVRSHFDVATLIVKLLGYDATVSSAANRIIYVNGSDVSGLAGYIRIETTDDEVQSVQMINGVERTPAIEELVDGIIPVTVGNP